VSALQMQSPEYKPQAHQKKKKVLWVGRVTLSSNPSTANKIKIKYILKIRKKL
jgi:hypothetical protein